MTKLKTTVVFQWNWNAIHAKNPDGTRKYRYIINKGSSRSSKTFSIIDCFDLYCRSNESKRLTAWRDTKTDAKKTVLFDTLKRLKSTGRYGLESWFNKTESIFSYHNDSTFEIHGTDDEETVHGLTQDAAWLNEPYKISRDTFDQIDQRTSDFILIDWNPKKDHWCEDLEKDPRTIVLHSTFAHNPFCPLEQKLKILSYQPVKMCGIVEEKLLQETEAKSYDTEGNPLNFTTKQLKELIRCRENEYKNSASAYKWSVYGLGLKSEKPNRIFTWKEISHEEYLQLDTARYYGCDWGKVDAWGVVEVKYYDGALYVHELNYDSENKIREKLTSQERILASLHEEGLVAWKFNRLGISEDSYIICDTNRPTKIRALREAGWEYALAAQKPAGSILDGIDLLDSLTVYYTSTSTNLKYEQENYSRKVDRYGIVLEEPEDKDNHLIDPLRYVASFLQNEGIISII